MLREFISRDGITPVNISEEIYSQVIDELNNDRRRYAFDLALLDIYQLMKKDSYQRFLSSSLFRKELRESSNS